MCPTKPSFEPYPDPKNSPLETKNVKNDPEIKSKLKESQKMKVAQLLNRPQNSF